MLLLSHSGNFPQIDRRPGLRHIHADRFHYRQLPYGRPGVGAAPPTHGRDSGINRQNQCCDQTDDDDTVGDIHFFKHALHRLRRDGHDAILADDIEILHGQDAVSC